MQPYIVIKPNYDMWYDTEQSDESTQDILRNRLVPMTGGQVQSMDVFNVRAMP